MNDSLAASRRLAAWTMALGGALLGAAGAAAQNDRGAPNVNWQTGPSTGKISDIAEIKLPAGYRFLGASDSQTLLQAMGNPTDGTELGILAPAPTSSDEFPWFVVFEFDDVGYVKDDEKESLDAKAMLESIKKGSIEGNKERRRMGAPEMQVIGWEQPPMYDAQTQNLTWAVRFESEGQPVINYNTRRLGRKGVMRLTVVCDPDDLKPSVAQFNSVMGGYSFTAGSRYGDFKPGDKIAQYGLAALITGGAAAVALKSGLFKWLWKGIIVVIVGIGAAIKGIFGRRTRTA